jgi:regulator of protease activity HflC (stomatin/prohibitin superfamily)
MADNQFPNITRVAIRAVTIISIGLVVSAMAGGCMTTTIRAGEGAVKFSPFGGTDLVTQYSEGLQIHAPWVSLTKYNLKIQEELEEMDALSSNGLSIGMDVSIRWMPIAAELPELHTTYGENYFAALVQPELRSALRRIVGRYTPEELYSSRRTEVEGAVYDDVSRAIQGRHVQIDAVLIRDIRLPEQISLAIEHKLEEEQAAERYEYTIAKERLEAERKKIEADGEAEYQRIITGSLSDQFLRFKGIEATQLLASSPNTKTIIVGGGSDGLPLILGNN